MTAAGNLLLLDSGREEADGLLVHVTVGMEGCSAVGLGTCPVPATTTATATVCGVAAFPTCTGPYFHNHATFNGLTWSCCLPEGVRANGLRAG